MVPLAFSFGGGAVGVGVLFPSGHGFGGLVEGVEERFAPVGCRFVGVGFQLRRRRRRIGREWESRIGRRRGLLFFSGQQLFVALFSLAHERSGDRFLIEIDARPGDEGLAIIPSDGEA